MLRSVSCVHLSVVVTQFLRFRVVSPVVRSSYVARLSSLLASLFLFLPSYRFAFVRLAAFNNRSIGLCCCWFLLNWLIFFSRQHSILTCVHTVHPQYKILRNFSENFMQFSDFYLRFCFFNLDFYVLIFTSMHMRLVTKCCSEQCLMIIFFSLNLIK